MSVQKRQPWMKWFPSDWSAEPRLRMVSRAARSLWVDMLGLMHQAEPYGFLIVGRIPLITAAQIARALGDSEAGIAPLLDELENVGVFSRAGDATLPDDIAALIPIGTAAGTILSRKMLRDQAKADKDRANGGKGGNPGLKGGDNPGVNPRDNPGDKGGVKAHIPETRLSTLLRNDADASGGKSGNGQAFPSKPSLDDKGWIFREGLAWLSKATGRPEDRLRPQLGKWRRDAKDDVSLIRRVFEDSQDQEIAEPIAWITAAIAARVKAGAPFEPTDAHGWRVRFGDFKDHGAWPAKWGGSRPGDHPAHPREILAEFGIGGNA